MGIFNFHVKDVDIDHVDFEENIDQSIENNLISEIRRNPININHIDDNDTHLTSNAENVYIKKGLIYLEVSL